MRMFRDFLGFLVAAGLSLHQVTVLTLLACMESLVDQNFTVSNIVNYMAGIRSYFIIYGLNTSPFRDERLHLFQRSLKYTRRFSPKRCLLLILISCSVFYLYLTLCNSLLSIELYISCPSSPSCVFPISCLTLLKVLIIPDRFAEGTLFFPKTPLLSSLNGPKPSKIGEILPPFWSRLLGPPPCVLIKPLRLCLWKFQVVLMIPCSRSQRMVPLFHLLILPVPLTFHLFCRSGTTWAFQHGVPIQDIMSHGTWSSDCVWRYVSTLPQHLSPVASTFKQHLHI